jgi:glyoxylase-like metal-dependent hydrolase (beta-lactamase superfamily II)
MGEASQAYHILDWEGSGMTTTRIVQVPLTVMGPGGVNAFLVIGSRPVIVDAGIPGSAPQIIDALAREGFAPDSVALIVVTHAHVDHAGDAWELKQASCAPVAVHRLDAAALAAGISAPVRGRTAQAQRMLEGLGTAISPPFHGVQAEVIVGEKYSLEGLGVAGTLIHTPGHTDGSLTLVLDSGEVIVGDLIGGYGSDPSVAALGPFSTDESAMVDSVKRVLALDPVRVYCGHGGPFEAEGLRPLRESTV